MGHKDLIFYSDFLKSRRGQGHWAEEVSAGEPQKWPLFPVSLAGGQERKKPELG